MSDWDLLQDFVRTGSEACFTQLVERYTRLVYGLCLRQLKDPGLAEDAAQAVFLVLAQRAPSLGKDTVLPGWLFKTAKFAACNAAKIEARRRKLEERSAEPARSLREEDRKRDDLAALLLDDALAGLSDADRNAVLLRFYEGRELKEVGAALAISEKAAEKRVSRAVEKLKHFFFKQGFVCSGTALMSMLSASAGPAAPVQLPATLARVCLAKAGGAGIVTSAQIIAKGTLKMMMWTKAQAIAAVAALVLIAGGTGVAGYAVSQSRNVSNERLRAAEEKLAALSAAIDAKEKAVPEMDAQTDRIEFVRQKLLLGPAQQAVATAQQFLNLTQARELAGQVTKLDVSNAEKELQNRQLLELEIKRKLSSVTLRLMDETGADPETTIPVRAVDFGDKAAGLYHEIRVDNAAGTVAMVTMTVTKDGKADQEKSSKLLFRARRTDETTALKEAEKTRGTVSKSLKREIATTVRTLASLELETLIDGQRVESAKRSAEASEISFERGLQSSFDVINAEDELVKAKMDFINHTMDHAQQLRELDCALGRPVDANAPGIVYEKVKEAAEGGKSGDSF